jgi:L-threonine kinase
MRGVARAPGTCGELVQGTVNGVNFLVTCPVDLYSVVEVTLQPGRNKINVNVTNRKVEEAVARTLAFFGAENYTAVVRVDSSLPVGKGMASSTADITAACVATAQALKRQISPDDIAGIALAIEPTDGIMYPGLVLFDHVAGRMFRSLGMPPEIKILIIDPGGTVDTEQFNARDNLPELNRQKEHTVCQALKHTEEGLAAGDPHKIGRAATMSALANQHIIFKPELAGIIKIAESCRALGVNTAHSGTVIGILYHEDLTDVENLKDILAATNREFQLTECILIGGGAEIPAPESGGKAWVPYNTYMAGTSGQRRQSMG